MVFGVARRDGPVFDRELGRPVTVASEPLSESTASSVPPMSDHKPPLPSVSIALRPATTIWTIRRDGISRT